MNKNNDEREKNCNFKKVKNVANNNFLINLYSFIKLIALKLNLLDYSQITNNL